MPGKWVAPELVSWPRVCWDLQVLLAPAGICWQVRLWERWTRWFLALNPTKSPTIQSICSSYIVQATTDWWKPCFSYTYRLWWDALVQWVWRYNEYGINSDNNLPFVFLMLICLDETGWWCRIFQLFPQLLDSISICYQYGNGSD